MSVDFAELGVRIRPAASSDATPLARLRFAFRSSIRPAIEPEEAFVARCAPWMASALETGGPWRCWVAERGGEIVGHLWLQVIEKVPNPVPESESHAYLTNVYVVPEARGCGVGGALMRAAMAWCGGQPIDRVILWPTRQSRSLYARHGFAVRDDVMEAVIEAPKVRG